MADAGFFRGTSTDQDSRFSNKEKKLLKTMKFDPVLLKKQEHIVSTLLHGLLLSWHSQLVPSHPNKNFHEF
eukprot:m.70854 g.70854  ORF g.70854 m.70854 type:complete len:71 (-) comp20114_c0_seq1:37-249(-)